MNCMEIANYKKYIIKIISDYFNIGNSNAYNLTRVKERFNIETITADDFEEFDEDTVRDLVDYIIRHSLEYFDWKGAN